MTIRELRPSQKLTAQCIAAKVVGRCGVQVEKLSLGSCLELHLGLFGLSVTILWVAGVTNASNRIDGLDGRASAV